MEEGSPWHLFYVGVEGQIQVKDNSQISYCGAGEAVLSDNVSLRCVGSSMVTSVLSEFRSRNLQVN